MSDFSISFSNPWLLLLLIPALFCTLFPYFRMAKRYRRTRNRITSMVLHMVVTVLAVTVLAGISFNYSLPNKTNEVILLVDMSYSGQEREADRDQFVKDVLDEGGSMFNMGIVTFGYDQVYAAQFSNDPEGLYQQYLNAKRPDDTATDIASALTYAKGLFTNPAQGKIVLISDGLETDGDALNSIKNITAEGVRVDTACLSSAHDDDVQLIGVTAPDYNIAVGDQFTLELTLQSSYAGSAVVTLYDGGVESTTKEVELTAGKQNVELVHTFDTQGLHELSFAITSNGDNLAQNNRFYSYIYLQVFDKILVLESATDESSRLVELLGDEYTVTVADVHDAAQVPTTLDELREYDQVIMMNVANADLPDGFDEVLYSYVYDVGGGLFTVGGNKEVDGEIVPNAYNRTDMYGTLYQQMLPVQAINYTPPVALMIIIDCSGSMEETSNTGKNKLDLAKDGAKACLNALSDRDYCGIMSLSANAVERIQLTPVPQRSKIVAAIDDIEFGDATIFASAVETAGQALKALSNVEKKHMIIVSDGQPNDPLYGQAGGDPGYGDFIQYYYDTAGITCSIVAITDGKTMTGDMEVAAEELGHGHFYDVWDADTLPRIMREDLNVSEVMEYDPTPFTPTIGSHTAVTSGVKEEDMPKLGGYYGTRLKDGADVPLKGEFVPVYAQWKFGEGMVGSFMCDLKGGVGSWSEEFLISETGQRILHNIINGLFPTTDIRAKDIDAELIEDNYGNKMSIFTELEEEEKIEITISGPGEDGQPSEQVITPGKEEGFTRASFTAKVPGLYTITIRKLTADGEQKSEYVMYKTFSWSEEYDVFADVEAARELLAGLARAGGGNAVEDAWDVFRDYDRTLHFTYDPRLPFMIAAIVLFVLDVAVRKFKFKWLHELIRDRKNGK